MGSAAGLLSLQGNNSEFVNIRAYLRVHVLLVQHEACVARCAAGPLPPTAAAPAVARIALALALLVGELNQALARRLRKMIKISQVNFLYTLPYTLVGR